MLTTGDIVARVDALLPEIRERGDEIAAARRLPTDLVASLKRAGVFRMPMPAAWGGPETPLSDQLRIVETLSTADPSVGWCAMIGSDAGFYSAFFDDATGRELWPDLDMVTAGWLYPVGTARPTPGGYVVNGRWAFGSGCTHADVIVGGCLVVDESGTPQFVDGAPVTRIAVAPADRFEIIDTWHTTGLAGSGSNDYVCHDLFVPAEHTFALTAPVRRPGTLYAMSGAFFANTHGVPLGLARRAIDEVIAIASSKVLMPQFVTMREVPRVQQAVAAAETALRSARAYSYATLDSITAELDAGRPLPPSLRLDLTLSRVQCFTVAKEIALQMVQLAGTQAVYSTSVLDRLARDAITINTHVVAGAVMSELAGGLALGIEPAGPFARLI